MKIRKITALALAGTLMLSACSNTVTEETADESIAETSVETSETASGETLTEVEVEIPDYAGLSADEIVASLTLEEKAAQMVQGALYNLDETEMMEYCYGSVLSHYGVFPELSMDEWQVITGFYQDAALSSHAGIPMLYGQDSVHGVNFASGCVIFPQPINIGAAHDVELAEEYGVEIDDEIST